MRLLNKIIFIFFLLFSTFSFAEISFVQRVLVEKSDTAGVDNDGFFINGVTFRLGQSNNFGFNREWKIVHMSSSKHLGYAFQWFSMAAALVILILIYFVRKKNG